MSFVTFPQQVNIDIPVMLMILAILGSAIAVVYTTHANRKEFVALQQAENRRDQLNEEWGRLLLEESTWAGAGRVEQQAQARLQMIVPTAEMTVVIKP